MKEKIVAIIKNIEDVRDCIEYSNFPMMDKYLEVFLVNYSKIIMDLVMYCNGFNDENVLHDSMFWTQKTTEIINTVKSKDVFLILDKICYETKEQLQNLADEM